MLVVSPLWFLALLGGVTLLAGVYQIVMRQRQMRELRRLAAQWQMRYTAGDRFRLAARVAERLGVPGASGVRVEDIIYGTEEDHYRYFFTAEYTAGVLRKKTDHRCVATFREPKDRRGGGSELVVAGEELSRMEGYREVRERVLGLVAKVGNDEPELGRKVEI
jgi:hypothetical protein